MVVVLLAIFTVLALVCMVVFGGSVFVAVVAVVVGIDLVVVFFVIIVVVIIIAIIVLLLHALAAAVQRTFGAAQAVGLFPGLGLQFPHSPFSSSLTSPLDAVGLFGPPRG